MTPNQQKIALLQQQLANATDPVEITHCRGQLIAALKKEYAVTGNPTIQSQMLSENLRHNMQISQRIRTNQHQPNHSIPRELGLKMRKTASITTDLTHSTNAKEAIVNTGRLVGQGISTAFTALKAPISLLLHAVNVASPYAFMAFAQLFQLHGFLFHMIINPDSPYNGQRITNMGRGLGEAVGNIALQTENFVRRI